MVNVNHFLYTCKRPNERRQRGNKLVDVILGAEKCFVATAAKHREKSCCDFLNSLKMFPKKDLN